jgi:LCP family protein required for cell wall assembly
MRVLSWFMLVVVLIGGLVMVGAVAFTYVGVRQLAAESPIDLPVPPQINGGSKPTAASLFATTKTVEPAATKAATQSANAVGITPTLPSLSDPSRVTILLLGIDQRKGEKGPFRTDTIIVISMDPVRKTIAMLSIPRDIYIPIPAMNTADRINNANALGELAEYPGGGPALAVRTVQSLIGVPIQRYAVVNFDVFTTVIDAIGPIQVCPQNAIHDDKYPDGSYGYITVDFKPGCQELDSTKLLQYARVRHNAGDDFGRAIRQQEVIRAVREKVMSLGGVSALIGKAGTIWDSLKDSIKTNMTFDEMAQIAAFAQSVPKENIQSSVITDKDGFLMPSTLKDGEQVFTPVYEKIHDLVVKLFNAGPGSSVVATESAATGSQTTTENAAILVSNGAGVDGMAKAAADKLRAQGFNIVDAKNADLPGGYGKSIIRVYTNKILTARALATALGLDGTVISTEGSGPPNVDIEVIVGKDLAPVATASP